MKNKSNKIYLDYAATTPVDKKVLKSMEPYFCEEYGNPASIHSWGHEAHIVVDKARNQVAKFLNCKLSEIIFTGSATESDNLAIRGLLKVLKRRKKLDHKIHIITSQIEHKAVLETCHDLENIKDIEITYLPVDKNGIVKIKELESSIKPETDIVSIMYVNNETGAIQPIKKIGDIIEKINKNRSQKVFFHTDAVQAASWLNLDVNELKVDLLTLSGHKIYGPKGVGVLYFKQGTPISSIITGGDHERGLRAGTENVPAIVGLGAAINQILTHKSQIKKTKKLRDKLIKKVLTEISNSSLNSPEKVENRAPHVANFSFKGVEGEGLVMALDQNGIGVSTGSACTSKELKPSHVLKAMGLSDLQAHSSLRISLGRYTTTKDIDYFLRILPRAVEKLRKISGR